MFIVRAAEVGRFLGSNGDLSEGLQKMLGHHALGPPTLDGMVGRLPVQKVVL